MITGRNHHSASFAGITELATGYDGYCCILPKECGTVLNAGGFTPEPPAESPAAITALATKDAGPPIPRLTAAQLQALIGADPNVMPLPDRNPMR